MSVKASENGFVENSRRDFLVSLVSFHTALDRVDHVTLLVKLASTHISKGFWE